MALPTYQDIMLPLLKLIADGKQYRISDTEQYLAEYFSLTEEERKLRLPSGKKTTFNDRIGWANSYLKKAGLIKSEKRGIIQITERGVDILNQNLSKIDNKVLEQFEEFRIFTKVSQPSENGDSVVSTEIEEQNTPDELLFYAYTQIEKDLAQDLLETTKKCSPGFFENLIIDLLLKMGYGGSLRDAGKAIGGTGDGGVDGIIKEDKLGLDIIYIQAKKWDSSVPVKEIRDFAGALLGKKARKGIFITTSSFSQAALDYVKNIEHKIVLIDGQTLANLMIEYNVGVAVKRTYEVKRIDTDYFMVE